MNTPPGGEDRRTEIRWLALIVGVGLLMRGAAILALPHTPESDELSYRCMALNLIHGNGIVDTMGNRAMYNMGYPFFILAPVFALFGESLLAARIANLLLGGVAILLCHVVARKAGAGRIGRLLAAAFWALYLPASVYGVYLLKEPLMIPLMLGVVWCALHLAEGPSLGAAAGCGILFGVLALTGNAALSLAGVVLVALLFTPATLLRRLGLGLCVAGVAVAVSAPWMIRNARVLGAPVLNTNGGMNFYLGNNPAATGWFVSIADTPRGPTWEALRETGEIEASDTLKREAIAWAKEHPARFLTLTLKKAVYFWMPPFHGGRTQASAAETVVRGLWAIQFVLLIAVALLSLCLGSLRSKRLVLLWIAVLCYTAIHMLFYVIFRYREPIMPVLVILAALAAESLTSRIRGGSHRASLRGAGQA